MVEAEVDTVAVTVEAETASTAELETRDGAVEGVADDEDAGELENEADDRSGKSVLVKVWVAVSVNTTVVSDVLESLVITSTVVMLASILELGTGVTTMVVVAITVEPDCAGVYPSSQEVVPFRT